MGTTVEELKKLYTKLGGKDKQVATFNQPGEVINAINELDIAVPTVAPNPEGEATADLTKLGINDDIYGIPTGLPAVTAEDNGKIAKVIEGAWDKADFDEPVVIVNCTYRYDTSSNILPDNVRKNTIISWIKNKKIVYLRCNSNTNNTDWVYMTYSDSNASWANVYFTRVSSSFGGGMLNVYWCNIVENSTMFKVNKFTIPAGGGLPEVTSADNGDVLAVVEGAWAKKTLDLYPIKFFVVDNTLATITFGTGITQKNLYDYYKEKKCGSAVIHTENNSLILQFELYLINNSRAYFLCTSRETPNKTSYFTFVLDSNSTAGICSLYVKTVNDPA